MTEHSDIVELTGADLDVVSGAGLFEFLDQLVAVVSFYFWIGDVVGGLAD